MLEDNDYISFFPLTNIELIFFAHCYFSADSTTAQHMFLKAWESDG